MIVFFDGVPAKSEYRKFKMRTAGNDDFTHMRETLSRRFSGSPLSKWPKPDLILIDGGAGQLSVGLSVLRAKHIEIPTIGLAKREEKIIKVVEDQNLKASRFVTITLEPDSEVLKLLQRVRDEAHRFAVAYHSLLRSKRQISSPLESIPGIGPSTRKKLVKYFGNVPAIKRATPEQVASVVGQKKAGLIRQYL
jgi:excinuclease ABC subunit C